MADEPRTDDNALRVFDLEDATIENIYANTTHAIVGEGDITLYLGFQQIESNDRPALIRDGLY